MAHPDIGFDTPTSTAGAVPTGSPDLLRRLLADPTVASLRIDAQRALADDLERHWPRVCRDVRRLVENWSEADRYASVGASLAALMADSAALGAAVRNRLASTPRWVLTNLLDDLSVHDPARYVAVQRSLTAAGVCSTGAALRDLACALERLDFLADALAEQLQRLAAETILFPA
jgi:hypothetical protein